jgi:hypothetical protein
MGATGAASILGADTAGAASVPAEGGVVFTLAAAGGDAGSGAGASQAPVIAINKAVNTRARHWIFCFESFMMGRQYIGTEFMEILSWFLVEALAAAALLALVVWWTWPRAPKDASEKPQEETPK